MDVPAPSYDAGAREGTKIPLIVWRDRDEFCEANPGDLFGVSCGRLPFCNRSEQDSYPLARSRCVHLMLDLMSSSTVMRLDSLFQPPCTAVSQTGAPRRFSF